MRGHVSNTYLCAIARRSHRIGHYAALVAKAKLIDQIECQNNAVILYELDENCSLDNCGEKSIPRLTMSPYLYSLQYMVALGQKR